MRQDEVNRRIPDPTYCPARALCVSLRLHACRRDLMLLHFVLIANSNGDAGDRCPPKLYIVEEDLQSSTVPKQDDAQNLARLNAFQIEIFAGWKLTGPKKICYHQGVYSQHLNHSMLPYIRCRCAVQVCSQYGQSLGKTAVAPAS